MNLNTNPAMRAPEAFTGTLLANEVFSSIYNMIISQQVFGDNIKGLYSGLLDRFKTDGSLFGDSKLFYATDCLKTNPWGGDNEAANLLALDRPADPACQKVVIDQFRQIRLTVDAYLSKRAWSLEGTFQNFQSVMLGWIGDTKRIFETKQMNVFVGTVKGAATVNEISVSFLTYDSSTAATEVEASNRINAQTLATKLADLADSMKDAERDYNDYGYLRSYDPSDLIFVYNSEYVNTITKLDLPTIFHTDGLAPVAQEKLPAKYFGRDIAASDCGSGKVIKANGEIDATKGTIRSKVEKVFTFEGNTVHVFPGDALASGVKVSYTGGSVSNPDFDEKEVYLVDASIICKILHKNSIPYMSAFETSTEFWNPRSLTSNHYLTFGYSELTYLKNYPLITVKKA